MDVESGSETSNDPARRKGDADAATKIRNLSWGSAPTDIELHPQSALSIVAALDTAGTSITLLPVPDILLENDHDPDLISTSPDSTKALLHDDSNITPILNRVDNRDRTMSVNLLTLQVARDLREKCKRLAVESALVKNRREKQLYLTVGIIHWTHPETDQVCQSPLLFYPVTLISEASRNGLGYVHQLYNAEGIPDYNYHLRDDFKQMTGITLPEYQAQQSVELFFERVADRVDSVENAAIDKTMRLGIATAPAGLNPAFPEAHQALVKLPARFSCELANQLIANRNLDDLQLTLNLIDASNDYQLNKDNDENFRPTADLSALRTLTEDLNQMGIGHVEFQQLSDLPERIKDWIACVEPVLESDLINRILQQRDIKAVQLMKLAGIIELLDKAPPTVDNVLHRDLAFASTPMLFKRARHQAKLIEDELAELQQHFHLDRLPAKSQLLQLIEELGGAPSADLEVIDSDYFNARRQFANFSTDRPTTLSEDHKRLLNKLVKVLRFRELFVNNTEYRLALGPAYRGLKTEWRKLESALNYAQELRTVIGSEGIAANALSDWQSFRQGYSRALSQLQAASNALRGMLKTIRPTDQNTTATEILVKSKCLEEELRDWKPEAATLAAYPDKTALTLLRLLSNHQSVDARTEGLVQDANSTIRHFLEHSDESDARLQLDETLAWLQDAVSSEDLSLDAIREALTSGGDNS